MRAAAAALLVLLLSSVASLAQSPVSVIGAVTPGHCASFFSTTQIQDAGVCGSGGGGGITGPGSSTVGDLAVWNNATGSALADTGLSFPGGFSFAGTLTGPTAVTFPISGTLATTATANVASVTGTAGQITATPTTGAVVVSLPATITANLTLSGTINHTGPFQIGGNTMAFPATADTLAGLGTAQTFTAPQTFSIAQTIASATAANWRNLYGAGATTTITGNTGSPITALYAAEIAQPTLTDASAVTVTNAATLFVGGPPIAAGSVTITNAWAIRVGTGNVSFPGAANALGTIASGTWNGSLIGLSFGGTNNALTASAGGIVWSDASKLNILAGTSTAGQCLLSGNLATPSWATCPGGGGTPGGANTNVQFNSAGAFGGDTGLTYAGAGGVLTLTPAANTAQPFLITGGSTTGSGTGRLGLSVVGTLNTTGIVDGSVLFANILNTASAVNSFFIDIQAGGTSAFAVSGRANVLTVAGTVLIGGGGSGITGNLIQAGNTGSGNFIYNDTANGFGFGTGGTSQIALRVTGSAANTVLVGGAGGYTWTAPGGAFPASAADTGFWRIAAGTVALGSGTAGNATGNFEAQSHVVTGATPTFTGTCTAPSAKSGGNTAGTWTVAAAGTCAAGTYILTFAFTAPNGWSCDAKDMTTPADAINQTASTTTTATFTATTANNDVVSYKCMAF